MRTPLFWLHEYCAPELSASELAERMDMTGTKVERVLRFGVASLDAFVVGRVLEAERHPDADRLTVCRVAVGGDDIAQIVCGAPNVAAGQTVAVAHPGAVIADGTELRTAKLRGVESHGMILAEDELGIGADHDGILVLEGGIEPGTPLTDVLPIAGEVLELEITPNRPDCLGLYGVAREVHAATGARLSEPPWSKDPGSSGEVPGVEVVVDAPELCPRFSARLFEDVTIGPSPPWLKARLTAAGQRPINNVVDITNYVMLLAGQPMHAFDFDRVAGGRLVVRRAGDGEQVETLDGEVRTLDSDVVVIDDAEGPTSIAGVMGGARSEVSPQSTRVLMEAATWNGPNIKRTSIRLGLRSEASARFEKQLQPEQVMDAQAIAAQLMIELCGATLVPGTVDVGGPGPEAARLHLRERRVERLLGAPIAAARSAEILTALGFDAAQSDDGVDASVPYWRRADVTREVDLVEEVARIDGMERLPQTLPSRQDGGGQLSPQQRAGRRVEDALAGMGLLEVAGWSLQGPDVVDRLRLPQNDPRRRTLALRNPLSEEQSLLRTMVIGSLLEAARHNAARGVADLRLFEVGSVYLGPPDPLPDERRHLGVLCVGAARPAGWRSPAAPADFFSVKAMLDSLLETLRVVEWSLQPSAEPFLHPGRSAELRLADGDRLGWLGELHPLVAQAWDLEDAAAFELDLGLVLSGAQHPYQDVSAYPAVRQDIAVVVPDDVPAARVREVVRAAVGELLARADVFDVYRGEQVGEGRVSLALALEFRAPDRTLTDAEVAEHRDRIAAALAGELGGELRA
jgi:phenylalanyl-tRNA synthetase beta chain